MVGRRTGGGVAVLGLIVAVIAVGLGAGLLALLTSVFGEGDECGGPATGATATGVVLAPPGTGQLVGATEYGGPGDPSSGVDRVLRRQPARTARQLCRARRRDLPDGHRDGRPAVPDAAPHHLGHPLGDRLQARHRTRGRSDRRLSASAGPLVGACRAARHPVRGRVVVGTSPDRAPAGHRRRQPARTEPRKARPALLRARPPSRIRPRARRRPPRACHWRAATMRSCSRTGSPRRPPMRPPRSRRSSRPATRSSASHTCTAAATGSRCPRSRRHTTARAASNTCCTARACCRWTTTRRRERSSRSGSQVPDGG